MNYAEKAVLEIVAEADGWISGIEVAERWAALPKPRWRRFFQPFGTAYVALAKLQRDGYVTARWRPGPPRPRREFILTPATDRE